MSAMAYVSIFIYTHVHTCIIHIHTHRYLTLPFTTLKEKALHTISRNRPALRYAKRERQRGGCKLPTLTFG